MKKKISRKIEGEKSISLLAIDLINSEMCRFHEIYAYITIKDINGKIYSMHCHNSTRIKYELETLYNIIRKTGNIYTEITIEWEEVHETGKKADRQTKKDD